MATVCRRVWNIGMSSLKVAYAFAILSGAVYGELYPTCGSCWCIPAMNGSAPCTIWQPQSTFAAQTISAYQSQKAAQIYTIDCNPYEDSACTTSPAQTLLNSDEAVCGYVYSTDADGTQSCTDYSMVTYASRTDLIRFGAVITHEGSCGLCSTTQDLSVYLSKLCDARTGLCRF
jgi:hypothetical protein